MWSPARHPFVVAWHVFLVGLDADAFSTSDLAVVNSPKDIFDLRGVAEIDTDAFPTKDFFDLDNLELIALDGFRGPDAMDNMIGLCELPLQAELAGKVSSLLKTISSAAPYTETKAHMKSLFPCPLLKLRLLGQADASRIAGGLVYVSMRLLSGLWGLLQNVTWSQINHALCLLHVPPNKLRNESGSWEVRQLQMQTLLKYSKLGDRDAANIAVNPQIRLAAGASTEDATRFGILGNLTWSGEYDGESAHIVKNDPVKLLDHMTAALNDTARLTTQEFQQVLLVHDVVGTLMTLDKGHFNATAKLLIGRAREEWARILEESAIVVPWWLQAFLVFPIAVAAPFFYIKHTRSGAFGSNAVADSELVGPAVEVMRDSSYYGMLRHTSREVLRRTSYGVLKRRADDLDREAMSACNTVRVWLCHLNIGGICIHCIFCCGTADYRCCGIIPCSFLCAPMPEIRRSRGLTPWAYVGADIYSTRYKEPGLMILVMMRIAMWLYRTGLEYIEQIRNATGVAKASYNIYFGPTIKYIYLLFFAVGAMHIAGCCAFGNNIHHKSGWLLIPAMVCLNDLLFDKVPEMFQNDSSPSKCIGSALRALNDAAALALIVNLFMGGASRHDMILKGNLKYVRKRIRRRRQYRPDSWRRSASRQSSICSTRQASICSARSALVNDDDEDDVPPVPLVLPPLLQLGIIFGAFVTFRSIISRLEVFWQYRRAIRTVFLASSNQISQSTLMLHSMANISPENILQFAGPNLPIISFVLEKFTDSTIRSVRDNASDITAKYQRVEMIKARVLSSINWIFAVCCLSTVYGAYRLYRIYREAVAGFKQQYTLRVRRQRPYYANLGPFESSLLPGIIFSISMFAPYVYMCFAFVVGIVIASFFILWDDGMKHFGYILLQFIVPVFMLVVFKKFLRNVVFGRILMTPNGLIARPAPFAVVFGATVMINFINGLFYGITRTITIALFSGIEIAFSVDRTTSKDETSDVVFSAFLAVIQCTNEVQNPIFTCATRALCPEQDNTWLPEDRDCFNEIEVVAQKARARRRRIRNKFWLLVTLERNRPCEYNNNYNLKYYRGHAISRRNELNNANTSAGPQVFVELVDRIKIATGLSSGQEATALMVGGTVAKIGSEICHQVSELSHQTSIVVES